MERRVAIDLTEMGSITRSLGAVVSFVNTKLGVAGVASRLEAVDQTPKTSTIVIAGEAKTVRYTGLKQYALKVDVRAGERVAFETDAPQPAFYAVGQAGNGARLIKLEDVGGEAGLPSLLTRPGATADPIGAHVATGWFGPGASYSTAPAGAYEQRTNVLTSDGANNFETALRAPGEAMLQLRFTDGRKLAVSTAWRDDDLENWRVRSGENQDRAILDDLAERLTQLLHEQGIAAGVDVWENGAERGLSFLSGDFVSVEGFSVSGRAATLEATDPPGMVGGLRDGVFARRFEVGAVAAASDLFVGAQSFVFTTADSAQSTITVDGATAGIDAATLVTQLNEKLRAAGLAAAASLHDVSGALSLRIDSLHDLIDVSATLNGASFDPVLQAPGVWAAGGLPAASAGQPFGDGVRTMAAAGGSPLLTHTGAVDLEIVVDTPGGEKTITVSVSAAERLNDPDAAPGEWSGVFQERLDTALNVAGVYVDAQGGDLVNWAASEAAGHHIKSVSINANVLSLAGAPPALGIGGAFSVERSFTSAQAATGVSDDVTALLNDQTVAITFGTVWGEKTVSATLEAGDPRTLESAALRLNAALANAGYDMGVEAVALSGGGAGMRVIAGASHSIRAVSEVALGGVGSAVTLDPIDSQSRADDPVGAARVAERASRGAAISETSAASA
ncbi:MAG TPA: hypothetical protein DHW63_01345, partial [Hyphomonadaceae bacterium]|nr:hypothetical protein [Hyphomonadaceae bacterium]